MATFVDLEVTSLGRIWNCYAVWGYSWTDCAIVLRRSGRAQVLDEHQAEG